MPTLAEKAKSSLAEHEDVLGPPDPPHLFRPIIANRLDGATQVD